MSQTDDSIISSIITHNSKEDHKLEPLTVTAR